MRKPAFCIYAKTKMQIAAKLVSVFVFSLLPKYGISSLQSSHFCGCTARLVLDLVGNPKDRFFHNEAHFVQFCEKI